MGLNIALVAAGLILGAVGGYYYASTKAPAATPQSAASASANPYGNIKTNPYDNVKVNPFQ